MNKLTKVRSRDPEAQACETVDQTVILLAPGPGGAAQGIYRAEAPVGELRVQMPILGRDDVIMHVEISNTGWVTTYVRAKTWGDNPEFIKLNEFGVVEELTLRKLEK